MRRTWPLLTGLVLVAAAGGAAIAGKPHNGDTFILSPAQVPTTTAASVAPATVAPAAVPSSTTAAPTKLVYVIGDSYTGGSDMGGTGGKNWTAVASLTLTQHGVKNKFVVDGIGGSGYTVAGQGKAFPDRIPATLSPVPDVIVVFGSRNDGNTAAATISAAATKTFDELVAAAPGAKLLVIGPPWVNADVPATITADRDVVKQAAAAHHATFLDPLADSWFFGADAALIGRDGVHPTDDGHKYMADRIEPQIEQLLS